MAIGAVLWIANVTLGQFHAPTASADYHVGPLRQVCVVLISGIAEVDDGRVVWHCTVAFRHGLELTRQLGEQLGVVETDDVPRFFRSLSITSFSVSDSVHLHDPYGSSPAHCNKVLVL